MSPYKRDVKKKLFPFLSEGDGVACIQPNLSSGEAVSLAAYSRGTRQLTVFTRPFHDAMVVDAFGSGSYAATPGDALALVL
jgi:hypothetical protein